jgi:FMN-dependent NADH-azoreductase
MMLTQRSLLQIDSSARQQGSASRRLTQAFVQAWVAAGPDRQVTYRDIGQRPIPAIDDCWVAAYEAEPEARTPQMRAAIALSDQLLDELFAADCYVFGVPMYNLTIPATLKAYLDQVVRRDRTLEFINGKPQGLLKGKKALVITTRKFNYRAGTEASARNFLEPYLKAIFNIIGIEDITFIVADQLAAEPELQQAYLAKAEAELLAFANQW